MTKTTRHRVKTCDLKEQRDGGFHVNFTLADGTKGKMGPAMFAGLYHTLQEVLKSRMAMEAAIEAKGLTQKEKH